MDMRENRLVPGPGKPPRLARLKALAAGQADAGPTARPRRFKRAGRTWVETLAAGAVMASLAALALLERRGLPEAISGAGRPELPDAGMGREEAERFWALAAYEPSRFPDLLGVAGDDLRLREEDARRLQRLLSERDRSGR